MRVLVISDIHGNDTALRAVLKECPDYDELWCLGDIVGYGAGPVECIKELSAADVPFRSVAGNHDMAAAGRIRLDHFIREGVAALKWTSARLGPGDMGLLEKDEKAVFPKEGLTLTHGSPADPIWGYIYSEEDARRAFGALTTPVGLFGHTHVPAVFYESGGRPEIFRPRAEYPISTDSLGKRLLVNPGSVGQPRDGDPRASCMIFEPESMTALFKKVEYDVAEAQKKIRRAGLPKVLADRLAHGI